MKINKCKEDTTMSRTLNRHLSIKMVLSNYKSSSTKKKKALKAYIQVSCSSSSILSSRKLTTSNHVRNNKSWRTYENSKCNSKQSKWWSSKCICHRLVIKTNNNNNNLWIRDKDTSLSKQAVTTMMDSRLLKGFRRSAWRRCGCELALMRMWAIWAIWQKRMRRIWVQNSSTWCKWSTEAHLEVDINRISQLWSLAGSQTQKLSTWSLPTHR